MRSLLTVAIICCSTLAARCEEAYMNTKNQLVTCLGLQAREFLAPGATAISPVVLNEILKQKCGFLEDRAREDFSNFIGRQLGRRLSDKEQAETVLKIYMEVLMPPQGFRQMLVEGYVAVLFEKK
jgi:hypothetical protein